MKKYYAMIALSLFLTALVILLWNTILSTTVIGVGFNDFRLGINSLWIVFFALMIRGSWAPWLTLYVEIIHNLFSITGWGHQVLADIIILLMAQLLKEFINIKHRWATLFLIFIFLFLRHCLASLFWTLKISQLSSWGEMILGYLPECLILSLASLLIFKLFSYIWRGLLLKAPVES